jgi:hypothetical protein
MKKNNNSPLKFGMVANMNNIIGAIKRNPNLAQATGIAPSTGTVNTSGMGDMANPQVATPDVNSGNIFEGQKFQITPVQMKGSFSPACQTTASKIYGSEEEREASVSPLNKKNYGY